MKDLYLICDCQTDNHDNDYITRPIAFTEDYVKYLQDRPKDWFTVFKINGDDDFEEIDCRDIIIGETFEDIYEELKNLKYLDITKSGKTYEIKVNHNKKLGYTEDNWYDYYDRMLDNRNTTSFEGNYTRKTSIKTLKYKNGIKVKIYD